ncbi:hypothetical protein F4825DRAFT_412268 [Nemania diffusa]|nr:hypothetical protein F4825DRAFT_412268 [Nemania diffusa]
MVRQKAEEELEKARKVVWAAEQKFRNATKRTYFEAAKKARNWRASGRLLPAYIVACEGGGRLLRRF